MVAVTSEALALIVRSGEGLLRRTRNGQFILAAYSGLILKDGYWRWPERNLAGNAIDTFRCLACPSMTPCARSPARKSTAGVVGVRPQCGQKPGEK